MAVQRLSPTGNLLRNSRLFSLPPPLISPSDKVTATRRYDSETATLPYPTQQALETTPSSLARGDWGLKRSLPLKSTARTSTPTIRIRDIDSINHITDFDSAADHVLNLKKWQEINLPVSKSEPPKRRIYPAANKLAGHKSVFETAYDNTQPESNNSGYRRWKYRGPWIAGQTAGEFKEYAEQNIKKRKLEFREFVRERLERKLAAEERRAAIDDALPFPEQPTKVDEQRLDHHIKELRQDQQGRLFELIEEFLDLPSSSESSRAGSGEEAWVSPESGPPTTHPSAGLSYLRASGHTFNHPALGPQDMKQPIRARIIAVRDPTSSGNPTLGIAGVATEDYRIQNTQISARKKRHPTKDKDTTAFDQDVPGGSKVWVQPDHLTIDSEGRIKVRSQLADVKTTALYEQPEFESQKPMPDPVATADRRVPNLSPRSPGTKYAYGAGDRRVQEPRNPPREATRPAPLQSQEDLIDLLGALHQGDE